MTEYEEPPWNCKLCDDMPGEQYGCHDCEELAREGHRPCRLCEEKGCWE